MLKNQSGKFLLPTAVATRRRAELDARTPAYERMSLVFAPGDDSYPLINYEYSWSREARTDAATGDALPRLPAMGDLGNRGGNVRELPDFRRLHPIAGFHPCPERGANQPDQVVPGADGIVSLVIPLDGC